MRTTLRSKLTLLFMAFALVLALPAVALADNVVNDVTVGGNDTITAGGSTTINYKILNTNSNNSADPQNSCNPADGSVATLTINKPAAVTATPSSLSFNACDDPKPVVFSSSTPGNYNITVSVSDSGTGAYNTASAAFTLKVNAPADSTAPTSSHQLSSAANANGWHNQNVTVSLNATDNQDGSGVKEIRYSTNGGTSAVYDPQNKPVISTEGTTTFSYYAIDNANNSESPANSFQIKLDKTPPTVQDDSPMTQPNSNGWYKAAVTNQFSASDATSGLANSSQASFQRSSGTNEEGSAVKIDSGPVSDLAGNTNPGIDSAAFKIDLTKPNVSVTGVSNGATYTLGSVPTAGCNTTDALSGVDQHASVSSNGGPVGSVTVDCNGARDNAGNTNSASVTYNVNYNWAGFRSPVDNNGILNVAKAGSAIPMKFSLSGNQGLSILNPSVPKVTQIACSASTQLDQIEETVAASNSGLSYDSSIDQYNYVWKTQSTFAGKCYKIDVKLNDGTSHEALFKFNK